MARHGLILGTFLLSLWLGCGGKTIVDPVGGSGGSTTSSSTSTSTSTSTSSSGTTGCGDTTDCPEDWVCIFDTGLCARACGDPCDPCPDGEVCDPCATGSCPGCKDCVPACVAAAAGACDDQSDCEADYLCVYSAGACYPACTSDDCSDPNLLCVDCATSSCPCCLDCASACMPL